MHNLGIAIRLPRRGVAIHDEVRPLDISETPQLLKKSRPKSVRQSRLGKRRADSNAMRLWCVVSAYGTGDRSTEETDKDVTSFHSIILG